MAVMPPTVATTSTLAMVRTVESRGFETADLLAAAGLARDTVEDPDARIPGSTVLTLWNALRQRSGDPALQLAAPTTLPWGAYRVIDYLVDASATVGDGVRCFARYFGLIADGVELCIEAEGDERRLRLAAAAGGAVPALYVDYVFAALVGRIRLNPRPALRVRRVELRQPAPADAAAYEARYCAPVRFAAPADKLCFSTDEWDASMDHADAALARLLEEHAAILSARRPGGSAGFVDDVRRALAAALPEDAQAAGVARSLHVSVRTLQRRLLATGTTFRDVSDSFRRGLAEAYLADPRVSIAEVAFLLGFSDQTSFNRAFRRWTGAAPGLWRRRTPGAGGNPDQARQARTAGPSRRGPDGNGLRSRRRP